MLLPHHALIRQTLQSLVNGHIASLYNFFKLAVIGFSYLVGVRTLDLLDFFQGRTWAQLGSKWLSCCQLPRALSYVQSYRSWGLPPSQGSLPPETKPSRQHFSTASQQAGQGFIRPNSQFCPPSAQYRFLILSFHHEHLASQNVSVSTSREHDLQHISVSFAFSLVPTTSLRKMLM